jgi:hypothetical protein
MRPCGRAAEQRYELAASYLIEVHSVPHQPGPDCSNLRGSVTGGVTGQIRPDQRAAFSAVRRISSAPRSQPSSAHRDGIARFACQEGRRYRLRRRATDSAQKTFPAFVPHRRT